MAKRYNLCEKLVAVPAGRGKRVYLVLSKKMEKDAIIQKLERDGQFGKYQLIKPAGGDRSIIKKYLNHQHRRRTHGFPDEVRNATPGVKNFAHWQDPKKPNSNTQRRSTTFDSSGRLNSFDATAQSHIASAMKCRNGMGAMSRNNQRGGFHNLGGGLDPSWAMENSYGSNGGYGHGFMDGPDYGGGGPNNFGFGGNGGGFNNGLNGERSGFGGGGEGFRGK